ncbi:hypothetical protein M9Y10_020576 [Tritrichomonas musculus]|uniref:Chorein N-terminal domain-containing protein n=1 Tax=Tritrichomonas musculus TaxID=1915356 RepID=A0ABR2HEZ4_9EUKA
MLNTIASKILSLVFSEYIEALDSSQLNIALWHGSAHLENVSIKRDALITKSIPFVIKKGLLGSLDLILPWKHLSTESCEISIKNLLIVTSVSENFVAIPEASDPEPDAESSHKESEPESEEPVSRGGILAGVLAKVVSNLKVRIENVHVRFEIPLGPKLFAFGVTLKSFGLQSVDAEGRPAFTAGGDAQQLKCARVEGLAVYLDTDTAPVQAETAAFIAEMVGKISSDGHEFVLHPLRVESAVSIAREDGSPKSKVKVKVNSNDLTVFLTRQQVRCIAEMSRQSSLFQLRRKYYLCGRPDHYPRSERSSTHWWLYAYRATLMRSRKRVVDPKTVMQILKNRHEYLALYSQNRALNKTTSVELLNLEDRLDSHAITSLRHLAKKKCDRDSQNELELPDLEAAIEAQNAARNLDPFEIDLSLLVFNLKMIDENRKVILDFVAKEADARMTKNKFSSLTTLNFASLRVLNETNPLFPEILKTDPNSAQRLMISLKSEPDSPFGITVSSPQLLIVFDYKWIMLFKQFFAPDKVVIKTKERRSDEKNDQGKVPATVLELKKAIENYRPLDLDLSVNGASIKVLYNENVEDYNVTLSVTEAHLRSPPNYQLDPNDFSSLYDHFYIEFQDAMIHLNERQISSPLIGTFHIQSSIVSTDLFPCLKFEVDINNETVISISTFECNLLCEFYEYFSDVLGVLLPEEGLFEPEKNYRIACVGCQLNMSYEDKKIYEINFTPLDIAFTFKNFQTYLLIMMNKIKFYEYFSKERSPLIDCAAKEKPLSISAKLKKERRQMTLDLGKTILNGNSKALNFFINYLRFMDDYEVRLNIKDEPDPRNIWHKKFTDEKSAPMELSIIAHPLCWRFEDDLGKLKTDMFNFSFVLNDAGTDMFITADHPVITTRKLHHFTTVLDTNPNEPLRFEFHPLSMSCSFCNTKVTFYIPWFKTFFGYISSVIHYGKDDPLAPSSISYNDIAFNVSDLEAKIVYNPKINDTLTIKTAAISVKTPTVPKAFKIAVDKLFVYYGDRLFIETSELLVEMMLKVVRFEYGESFSSVKELSKRKNETKLFLKSNPGDEQLVASLFWIIGMKMIFKFNDISVDYNHQACHTFRKCIYSMWSDDDAKDPDEFNSKFQFLMTAEHAHLVFNKVKKFASIDVSDFSYHIVDDDQNVSFGDVSIIPLLESDSSYFGKSVFQRIKPDEKKPLLKTQIKGSTVIITFTNLNVYLHPTFILPFLYYIIDCPLFGEYDDPPRDPPLYLVFKSKDLHLTIPTKGDFPNYLVSFKFHWDWGEEEFIVKINNLNMTAENRSVPILSHSDIKYELVPNDENEPSKKRYTKSAVFTELKLVFSLCDVILLAEFFSLIAPTWDISHFIRDNSTEDEYDIYDVDLRFKPNNVVLCHSAGNHSQLLPFMKVHFDECKMVSKIENGLYTIDVSVPPTVLAMNFTTGSWDYLVEPFAVNFLLSFFSDHSELSITIPDEVNINVTSTFIKQIMQFKSDLLDDYSKGAESVMTFITLENRTGRPISFFSESMPMKSLDVDSRVSLPDFPEDRVLNIVLDDSNSRVYGFKPETIVYPTFIHQSCIVNSIPSRGARLITVQSPFAIDNKTSINLEIYVVSAGNDRSLIGIVKARSVFSIPYHVFLTSSFIFKVISAPLDSSQQLFKHKKWGSKDKNYPIVTSHGPLWCKIREEIDPAVNVGYIRIIPCVTFYNEMPVTLYVQMKRLADDEIVLKPGESADIATIAPGELNFKCSVRIDGYSCSKQKNVSLQFDTPSKKFLRKFILNRADGKKEIVGVAFMTNHSSDKSQAAIIFYTPCVIFNMFGHHLHVRPHQEETIYKFHHFIHESQLTMMITSSRFFKNSQLYVNIICPGLSAWSRTYIDCTATGMNDVIFLPKEDKSDVFVPVHYKVTQAEKPYFHTRIVTLVPALSIDNELDDDIYLEPDFTIEETNEKNQSDASELSTGKEKKQVNYYSVLDNNSSAEPSQQFKSYNHAEYRYKKQKKSEFHFTENDQMKEPHSYRELYPKHKKSTVLTTNYHFSFSMSVLGFQEVKGILLSSPVRTCFRLFSEDGGFQIIELEVVEDGIGLCAHFRVARFPTPYIFCNFLDDVELLGYQFNDTCKFVFAPNTTTMFALDVPFGRQSLILEYNGQSIIISLNEETNSLPLAGTPFMIKIMAVNNGNQMIIVSKENYAVKHKLYNVSGVLKGISISFIDSLMRESILVNFSNLNLGFTASRNLHYLSISLDSFEIDDQCLRTAFPVTVIGNSTSKHKFLVLNATIIRGAPFLIAFKNFSFQLQKILVFADLAFISDIFSLTLDTFYPKENESEKSVELKPPIENPEQPSVGKIYSFKRFIVSPILFEIYYRSVTGRDVMYQIDQKLPLTMFKLIGNITGANVCLNGIVLNNFRAPLSFLRRNIVSQYSCSLMSQLWSLAGHSDILLNTVGIAESFSSGVKVYYNDPDMFQVTEFETATRSTSDNETTTKSTSDNETTARNETTTENETTTDNETATRSASASENEKARPVHANSDSEIDIERGQMSESKKKKSGSKHKKKKSKRAKRAFGSILQSGEGFLRGVSTLFSINSFGTRSLTTGGLNQTSSDTVKDGLVSFGSGFVRGVTGIIMDPVNGGKKDGVKGAFIGIGKGLAGVVMKPLTGLLDVSAGMIGGVRQAINNGDNIVWSRHRIPRRFPLNKVAVFDVKRSTILIGVFRKAFSSASERKAMCAYVDDANFKYVLCLCDDSVYFIDRKTDDDVAIKKVIKLDTIAEIKSNGNYLSLLVRKLINKNEVKEYIVNCNDHTTAQQITTMVQSYKIRQSVF